MPNITTNHAITYTNTNEMTSHMKNKKKKICQHKILEWNITTELAHMETGDKAF